MLIGPQLGALIEPLSGRRWDRPETMARIASRVGDLRAQGVERGTCVFLHDGNTLEFFVNLLAAWWLGGSVVPVDTRLTAFEVETLARAARPKLSIVNEAIGEDVRVMLAGAGIAVLSDGEMRVSHDAVLPRGAMHLDDMALILFTSGTTGDPKGVVHTHRSLLARWTSLRQALGTASYMRTLCLLPTHFGHGLICNALFPWLHGADLHIAPPFRADIVTQLGALIDEHEISFMSSVPTVWNLALRMARPPRRGTLRRVHCGSAPLSAHIWSGVQTWTGTGDVLNTYGITETASWAAGTTVPDFKPEDGLIGVSWGTSVKVVRRLDGDTLCGPGEEGYILLNTPALMAGYFNQENLTADVVRQGWFVTGDIGLVDDRGLLYLRGREREEINKGGMKIHPGDVDGVAQQCPGIADACTFAVDDALYGQDVGIALVVGDADKDPVLARLRELMAARLAKHQIPVRWYLMESIPRTSRGKINRAHVAATCAKLEPYPMPKMSAGG